ncbi:GNAT family N-acetyltransferase [Massilia rubra]|uniref:GNAT family N-acetyltransferase n=1 Tax=Massilia rubra TaxID=2607910 RepID=A0ABX0M1Q3_9BURK|nr:GNAT family N-acetyltransferase [Massilia rubra]NHZ37549.1 GNAT family N-acetyltransferase [Massilia rubra]
MSGMNGQALFAAYKLAAGAGADLVIPVGRPVEALLRPIATASAHINLTDARLLSEWRNRFVTSFLTEFDAHETRTANWLATAVAHDPGKILFMVDTLDGRPVGHVGLGFIDWDKGYVEADAIVRGGECRKGLMTAALQALLHWARVGLGLPDAWVRVRSDNPAVAFYRKAGFSEVKRVPLASSSAGGQVTWTEDPAAGDDAPALVYMRYQAPV